MPVRRHKQTFNAFMCVALWEKRVRKAHTNEMCSVFVHIEHNARSKFFKPKYKVSHQLANLRSGIWVYGEYKRLIFFFFASSSRDLREPTYKQQQQ